MILGARARFAARFLNAARGALWPSLARAWILAKTPAVAGGLGAMFLALFSLTGFLDPVSAALAFPGLFCVAARIAHQLQGVGAPAPLSSPGAGVLYALPGFSIAVLAVLIEAGAASLEQPSALPAGAQRWLFAALSAYCALAFARRFLAQARDPKAPADTLARALRFKPEQRAEWESAILLLAASGGSKRPGPSAERERTRL